MVDVKVRACARCHNRKIKCSGYPNCRACIDTDVPCEPHTRRRKEHLTQLVTTSSSLKDAEHRIRWLEKALGQQLSINCHTIATGSPLPPHPSRDRSAPPSVERNDQLLSTETHHDFRRTSDPSPGILDGDTPAEHSDMSLLALNATGDQRYLGPSSGSFFSSYATAILRSCAPDQAHFYSEHAGIWSNSRPTLPTHDDKLPIQSNMVALLQRSYEVWISPLYPVMSLRAIGDLITRCTRYQATQSTGSQRSPINAGEMALFYLIMALGAMNRARTLPFLQRDYVSTNFPNGLVSGPSPAFLYAQAMSSFQKLEYDLQPSPLVIQVLLLVCIYSSQSPLGPSQWQLAGFAMRSAVEIGLHRSATSSSALDHGDDCSRVFWTAYAIEITIAYNLGRPPSIGEEHITAELPLRCAETTLALQHIKHRQIQGRIISEVYCGTSQTEQKTAEERSMLINNIQIQLDDWRSAIDMLYPSDDQSPYPHSYWDRLYHGTTFVLHRKSPLCPKPSAQSVEHCIRAAGAYINDIEYMLKHSEVPTSWMLVQGVLFAGVTMVVTARTSFVKIPRQTLMQLLMIDYPAWTRQCAVCLAIMNERWDNPLLPRLAAEFDILADSTLRIISTVFTSSSVDTPAHEAPSAVVESPALNIGEGLSTSPGQTHTMLEEQAFQFSETYDSFADLFGTNGASSFWDFSTQDANMDANAQFGFLDIGNPLGFDLPHGANQF